jgi:hypothetical protein
MRAQIKWFTRLPIGILFLFFLVLNPIAPEFVEEISTSLGLAKPSLVTIIGVATLFFILERIIVIEDGVIRGTTLPLRTYLRRDEAYADLSKLLGSDNLPSLLHDSLLVLLTDPFVIVHSAALRALDKVDLPAVHQPAVLQSVWRIIEAMQFCYGLTDWTHLHTDEVLKTFSSIADVAVRS